MKRLIFILILCLTTCIAIAQTTTASVSDTITKANLAKDSQLTILKTQPIVATKLVDVTDIDGKTRKELQAVDDIGITIHHHWLEYGKRSNTIIQAGKNRYAGTATFDEKGDMVFNVKGISAGKVAEVIK